MRTLISGSTGLIGTALTRRLEASGHQIVRLTRPGSNRPGVAWDPEAGTIDRSGLEGFDAVVHLAGENIADRRWSARQKTRIRDSRVGGTALLANALAGLTDKPAVLASASAAGYFGDRGDELLSDDSAVGSGFLATTTRDWEEASAPAAEAGIRVVNMRIGIVLSASGGMLKRVLPIFKLGLGGRLGSGSQYMSWITRSDLVDAIVWVLEHERLSGALNVGSPNPVTNAEFTRTLAGILGRPALFAAPEIALRITQGEVTDAALASVRMGAPKLMVSGFEFRHPDLEGALRWAVTDTVV